MGKRPLKIRAYFHMFPGSRELGIVGHNAGSETTVHAHLRAMVQRGHDVKLIADQTTVAYTIDGIEVVRPPRRGQQSWITEWARDADIIMTHLDCTRPAMQLALDVHKPIAHWVHNDKQLRFHYVTPNKAQLLIFNSHWIAEKKESWEYGEEPKLWPGYSIVVHPTVEPDRYRCERGNRITLVNPTPGKGAGTFYALAKALPDLEFLAVKSVYGEQIMPPHDVHNVKVMEHTPDIREAFQQTKVLLMPSEYESYGRVAVEAACCGIPTIAHPTPGLLESLGEAGIFQHRNDVPAWKVEIERLVSDEAYYAERSNAALGLADSLNPEGEFDRLEEALLKTVLEWESRESGGMKMWVSDRRLYKTASGQVTENLAEAQTLYAAVGTSIPLDEAIALGLVPRPAVQVVPGIDTRTLLQADEPHEEKAIESPEENKAILSPAENKMEAPKENKGKRKKAEAT